MANPPMPVRTVAPEEHELVRLYNQTERKFMHDIILDNKDHTVIKYDLKAHSFGKVAPEIAKMWLEWFPNQIVSAEDAVGAVQGSRRDAEIAKEQLAQAQKRIEELEKKVSDKTPIKPRRSGV